MTTLGSVTEIKFTVRGSSARRSPPRAGRHDDAGGIGDDTNIIAPLSPRVSTLQGDYGHDRHRSRLALQLPAVTRETISFLSDVCCSPCPPLMRSALAGASTR